MAGPHLIWSNRLVAKRCERVMKSVPKAVATGSFFGQTRPWRGSDPVATAPGTDSVIVVELFFYEVLKRCRLIPSFLIFDSSVCLGIPSLVAAPVGPEINPSASRS